MSDERDKPLDDALEREIQEALGDSSLLGVGKAGATGDAPPPGATPGPRDVVVGSPEAGAFADATIAGVGVEEVIRPPTSTTCS